MTAEDRAVREFRAWLRRAAERVRSGHVPWITVTVEPSGLGRDYVVVMCEHVASEPFAVHRLEQKR